MNNILTSISLEKTIQPSLQLDAEKKVRKKNTRHTIESVKQHIESFKGYRLLSTQFVNVNEKLDILCPKEHLYKVSYDVFQRGVRCAECSGCKKLTFEFVKQYIESFSYKLISTQYVNAVTNLEISCPKNHTYFGTYNNFQRGNRCAECRKHTFESVKQHIESFKGYRLLSTEYLSTSGNLDILCPKEHLYKVCYAKFQKGNRCAECHGNAKHRLSNVKRHIESFGYRLRSNTYVGAHANLDILCPNEHLYPVSYSHFRQGARCPECDDISKRRTMLNGEDWKPALRNSTADIAWRKAVKKRDGQICQACFFPNREIHAHHIESYGNNIDLRNELDNGVTLCEQCHRELHSRYGKMTATRVDLEEFTRLKCF